MANQVFNCALGRFVEWHNIVKTNALPNSALVIMVLATAGLESDVALKDKDTFADIVSGTTNEVTNVGYSRKVWTDADLVAYAPDDPNDRVDLDSIDIDWGAITAGDGWSRVVIGYDSDTTAGTDANIIPIASYDAVFVPDGSTIQTPLNAAGYIRAA